MRTVRFTTKIFCALLALLSNLALLPDAVAQDRLYCKYSGKGHWKLLTDPVNRNTTIRFFDEHNRLIYEEVLSGRYVKLTDRNVALLSRTLNQVAQNTLLLDRVKSTMLPVGKPGVAGKKAKATAEGNRTDTSQDDRFSFGIRINFIPVENTAKFSLLFENPARRRVDVELEDEKYRLFHAETVNSPRYKRSFDLQSLPKGTYTLRVMTVDRKYKYTKQITLGSSIPQTNHFLFNISQL